MADFIHKLSVTVSRVLLLVCLPVAAQDVSQEQLAACAAMPTAAGKLTCYEALTVIAEPAPAAVAGDSRSTVPQDLGAKYLERDERPGEQDSSPMSAVVREVTQNHSGRLNFHFSNGQVWRQIEPRRFRYPKNQEFEVTISQGIMGDYRLRVGGEGPMTRIRRVE